MIKVGLTGNRFSGKHTVSNLFKQIGIPVFDADVVLKFILNYNLDSIKNIKEKLGDGIYKIDKDFLDIKVLSSLNIKLTDKLLDIVDFELRTSYDKFIRKNKNSTYTVFMSSFLFERGLDTYVDFKVNVFCPKRERINRGRIVTNNSISSLENLLRSETDDLLKNKLSDYVIHNYENSEMDLFTQINDIDLKLIDKYISETNQNFLI
jgi:dephospho-CoA kinase